MNYSKAELMADAPPIPWGKHVNITKPIQRIGLYQPSWVPMIYYRVLYGLGGRLGYDHVNHCYLLYWQPTYEDKEKYSDLLGVEELWLAFSDKDIPYGSKA